MRLHRANSHAPEAVVGGGVALCVFMNRELENLELIPFLGTSGSVAVWSVWYGLGMVAGLFVALGR